MRIKDSQKKIMYLALVLLIIAGVVVVALKGFATDLNYEKHQRIEVVLGKEFDKKDIQSIASEVMGKKEFKIKTVELFNDAFSIEASNITDEEKNTIVEKVNEKYGTELKADDISQVDISNVRIRDIVIPYIMPICIVVFIVAIFVAIRYRKMFKGAYYKVPLKMIFQLIIVQASLVSIVAIIRIPFDSLIMPILVACLITQMMIFINLNEKILNKKGEN